LDETRASAPPQPTSLPPPAPPAGGPPPVATAVGPEALATVVKALTTPPEGFTLHPKIAKVLDARHKLWASGQVDWALAEALAYGTIVLGGQDVRLCGQDTRRGTFGHRNAVYVDYRTGAEHVPLAEMARGRPNAGRFFVYDSLLSEYAALGFEYGYSLFAPDALVAWEAQFGDFANGAQVVIDQFLTASEGKWDQRSRLLLLLPHGYEGQGPEHSSGRVERFLSACAEDNMCVANVTTGAQLFHILRRHVLVGVRRPLVLFTPKRYLRGREAYSSVEELTSGGFWEVLEDPGADAGQVSRVVLASGKVALDVLGARGKEGAGHVAVVRVEQLYPWPQERILSALSRYPSAAELVWVQEEPANMGPWPFVRERLDAVAGERKVSFVARLPSGSPATGSHALHELEQADILARALGVR
ncbi:MAG: multifunctional oxoglutarate decarboxylase/oxoglutarate dehydrogenase thiamine pyrophosphate-binding subunit/dihydrolipoyllysine-residue succinyltransferase subunit, partial [Acidimicrobiales bacterium]